MAKTKKATPSPVDEKVYDIETTYRYIDGTNANANIKIKSSVSLVEMSACINNIVDGVINNLGYTPYFHDISFYGNLLETYSNFDISIGFEKLDNILCKTDLKSVLHQNISNHQWETIYDSVDELIEYRKQHSIKSEIDSTFTGLLNDLRSLLAKANNFLDLDPDVLGKVVNNLAGMTNITESKLVDALIEKSGVAKGKGGRKANKGKMKDNVVELPLSLQQTFEDGEVSDTEVSE